MREGVSTARNRQGPHNSETSQKCEKNIINIVGNKKKPASLPASTTLSQSNLIKYTEYLNESARKGTLKGLGGFAEFTDGYVFGLEGSYLLNPSSAVLPLERLKSRIMRQIEEED